MTHAIELPVLESLAIDTIIESLLVLRRGMINLDNIKDVDPPASILGPRKDSSCRESIGNTFIDRPDRSCQDTAV